MEEVEIFLNADREAEDQLQDIVCPPPSSKRTTAQRRWRLVKNMAHAQYTMKLLTSLTDNEKALLDSLASKESLPDSALCAARRSIRMSIHRKASNLTEAEVEFLHRLTEAPHITAEQLEKTQAVLLKDPLYASELDRIEEERDQTERRRSLTEAKRDASFRTQVWEYCGSNTNINSERSFSYRFQGASDSDIPLDFPVVFTVLGTAGVDDPECQPHVLSPPIMDALRAHLPFVVQQDNFWLKYSSLRDGFSMRAFLHKSRGSAKTIVAVETLEGDVFGAFASSPWREQGQQYYGSGEAFLWRLKKSRNTSTDSVEDQAKLESEVEFFEWSGKNRNVQRLVNADSDLIIGGGGPDDKQNGDEKDDDSHGSGLVLSPCLTRGHSHSCLTFNSPSLLKDELFEIANVEVWTLTPVDTMEQAEKVELGRHFVFDQGNFALD